MSVEKQITFGKKVYSIMSKDDPIWNYFHEGMALLDQVTKEYLGKAKFGIIVIEPEISKKVVARIIRTSKELKLLSNDYDFIIEVSSLIFASVSDNIRSLIMYHELLHCDPVYNEKLDKIEFKLKDHDVKDFYVLVDKYGISWFHELQEKAMEAFVKEAAKKYENKKNGQELLDKFIDQMAKTKFTI